MDGGQESLPEVRLLNPPEERSGPRVAISKREMCFGSSHRDIVPAVLKPRSREASWPLWSPLKVLVLQVDPRGRSIGGVIHRREIGVFTGLGAPVVFVGRDPTPHMRDLMPHFARPNAPFRLRIAFLRVGR